MFSGLPPARGPEIETLPIWRLIFRKGAKTTCWWGPPFPPPPPCLSGDGNISLLPALGLNDIQILHWGKKNDLMLLGNIFYLYISINTGKEQLQFCVDRSVLMLSIENKYLKFKN